MFRKRDGKFIKKWQALIGGKGVIELRNLLNRPNPDPTCGFSRASQWDQLCEFALMPKFPSILDKLYFRLCYGGGGALQRKRTC